MSDREMRRLLQDVIADIEAGRVKPRRRFGRLKAVLGGGAIVATLALAGCDTGMVPAYGVPMDGTVQYDAASDAEPQTDAEADAGPVVDYGGPDIDAGVDAGPVVDYGGPDIDAGAQPEYGSP